MATVSTNSSALEPPDGFRGEVLRLVADTAPRLFAVVQEYLDESGDLDACVAAWGLAHEDGTAHVVAVDGSRTLSLRSPERACFYFSVQANTTARVIWPDSP